MSLIDLNLKCLHGISGNMYYACPWWKALLLEIRFALFLVFADFLAPYNNLSFEI